MPAIADLSASLDYRIGLANEEREGARLAAYMALAECRAASIADVLLLSDFAYGVAIQGRGADADKNLDECFSLFNRAVLSGDKGRIEHTGVDLLYYARQCEEHVAEALVSRAVAYFIPVLNLLAPFVRWEDFASATVARLYFDALIAENVF